MQYNYTSIIKTNTWHFDFRPSVMLLTEIRGITPEIF